MTRSSSDDVDAITAVANATFDTWYRREYHPVVSLIYVLSGSRWAAEELAQDAFLEAHRRWATVGAYDDPGAWVRKVAVNKAQSWGRRRGAEARAYAKHLGRTRDLPAELPASADAFWSAVRSLPERQAQIVALHYHDDRPVDDIAALLDISPSTVKTQLHLARKSLTSRLELDDGSDEPVTRTTSDPQERDDSPCRSAVPGRARRRRPAPRPARWPGAAFDRVRCCGRHHRRRGDRHDHSRGRAGPHRY